MSSRSDNPNTDLCNFLNSMGAKIDDIGTHKLKIKGVNFINEYIQGKTHQVERISKINGSISNHLDNLRKELLSIRIELLGIKTHIRSYVN